MADTASEANAGRLSRCSSARVPVDDWWTEPRRNGAKAGTEPVCPEPSFSQICRQKTAQRFDVGLLAMQSVLGSSRELIPSRVGMVNARNHLICHPLIGVDIRLQSFEVVDIVRL
jgi:hypothetical protein